MQAKLTIDTAANTLDQVVSSLKFTRAEHAYFYDCLKLLREKATLAETLQKEKDLAAAKKPETPKDEKK